MGSDSKAELTVFQPVHDAFPEKKKSLDSSFVHQ